MKRRIVLAMAASVACGALARPSVAQEVAAVGTRSDAVASAADELLSRLVTVNVTRVSLKQAIDAAAASAHVLVQYREPVLEAYTKPVTLHLTNVTLRTVLGRLFAETTLRVVPDGTTQLAIVDDGSVGTVRDSGVVHGRVINGKSQAPVAGANVILDDSVRRTVTDADGRYHFVLVSAGTHTVRVRAVGFARQSHVVTVNGTETPPVDFVLESTVNTLDQVVVTATGEQRYRELGHVVANVNADSLVRNAPITSVAELLTARIPGLQVLTSDGGMAGGEVALRLRGTTTTSLNPQPIIIVDGVRYKSTNTIGNEGAVSQDQRPMNVAQRSPLNDLNVNDIETVEVVKGPSASTLYGPDAANGVIVITTKHAKAGKTEWHVYAHPRLNDITNEGQGTKPLRGYWGWGHDPNTGETVEFSCTLESQFYGQCVQDSIALAPLAAAIPDLNIIAQNRPQWQFGADVSGGSESLRYFLSGGYDTQTGSLRIPPLAAELLKEQLGVSSLSDAIRNPNTQQITSTHAALTADPNTRTTVDLSASYSQVSQRAINASVYQGFTSVGAVIPTCSPTDRANLCFDPSGYSSFFLQSSQQQGQRFTGSGTGVLRPTSWLTATATLGTDLDETIDRAILPAGSITPSDGGQASDYRRNNINRTATLNVTALGHPGRFSFRTSVGAQYGYTHEDGLNAYGQNLAPGSTSISTATYLTTSQVWSEVASLGSYGEEVVGLNNRLFLTAGLRFDGSTSLGDKYHPRPFPKVSASWIASEEPFFRHLPGVQELRFRASYGASSQYPTSGMKIGGLASNQDYAEGVLQNEYSQSLLGNPFLRPERAREMEYGVDATLWSGIVTTGLTWYHRRADDQLQQMSNPNGLPSQWVNVGDITAHGFEATLDARLFQTRSVLGTLQFSYSYHTDKLLNLGALTPASCCVDVYRVGYPLGAAFDQPVIGYADTVGNHADGIILQQEVVRDSVYRFMGVLFPPRTYALTPQVTFLDGRIRVSTTFDRQAGFVVQDNSLLANGMYLALLKAGSPPLAQARAISYDAPFEPGDFTRWRELNIGTDLPVRLMHLLLLSRGAVNFQMRNIALWTRYKGSDPEAIPGLGTTASGSLTTGTSGIPLARVWTISFDVTP